MGWRFNQRIQIVPGLRFNIGLKSCSFTLGVRGAGLTAGTRGARAHVGLPGSGLSYNKQVKFSLPKKAKWRNTENDQSRNDEPESVEPVVIEQINNIFSADVDEITSVDMQAVKGIILDAIRQKQELADGLKSIEKDLSQTKLKQLISRIFLFGFLPAVSDSITDDINNQKEALSLLKRAEKQCTVDLQVHFDDEMKSAHYQLRQAFDQMAKCACIWDITGRKKANAADKTGADTEVTRKLVSFSNKFFNVISKNLPGMYMQNANGADIYLFPNFLIFYENDERFGVIGIDELIIEYTERQFIEHENIPADADVVGKTWFKVNKNGSPDKRFKDNYEIPVTQYGYLTLRSGNGLNEMFMISNRSRAELFFARLSQYQKLYKASLG